MLTSYLIMHYHIVYFLLSTVCGNDEFWSARKQDIRCMCGYSYIYVMYVDNMLDPCGMILPMLESQNI